MGITHSQRDAALERLYAAIPAIPDCDGRCWISCGPIAMSDRERQRIRQAGYRITPHAEALARAERFWCEALTGDKRCAVYDMRPVVCRLWGAVEDMRCPFGCVPEGGWLSTEDGARIVAASLRYGGGEAFSAAEAEERIGHPLFRELMEAGRDLARTNLADRAVPDAFRRKT